MSLLVLDGRAFRRRPFDPSPGATPAQEAAFVSRMLSDASGEERRVEVLVDGTWVELRDGLTLEVLERCGGDLTAAELTAELLADSDAGVGAEDVAARLEELYSLRLISMARS